MPFAQRPIPYMAFILKSRLASGDLLPVIRQNLSSIDSQLPIYDIRSLTDVRRANISSERMSMILIVGSAAIALLLSVIGVYGILAYSVTQRRREIGVRLALGARRRRVVNLLLRQGVVLALIGIAVGLIGAFSVSRVLSNLLYSVVPNDPFTYLVVSGVLIFAVILACAIPALRASRISPLEALQSD
ncbi:MAG: FtsX-like permease family protein [Cyanothece sp. SIO1E1]|nr:FtsX-like permease family protein [Cyanothece sp. SIO1E1]